MLNEVLSRFPQRVLSLPMYTCISVTSECCQSGGVIVSNADVCYCLHITFE